MTRIASGSPDIWPSICLENREAIVGVLEDLIRELERVKGIVAERRSEQLVSHLEGAREARRNLPTTAPRPDKLVELRLIVPDRPGVLASVTTTATEHEVNIYDIEIVHSAEGPRGVLVLTVDSGRVDTFVTALEDDDYAVTSRPLT